MEANMIRTKQIEDLARRVGPDCYSYDRYQSFVACAIAAHQLVQDRTTITDDATRLLAVEAILRSKLMRWASDNKMSRTGPATSSDLVRYVTRNYSKAGSFDKEVREIVRDTFGKEFIEPTASLTNSAKAGS
jgi:hypothetical protein